MADENCDTRRQLKATFVEEKNILTLDTPGRKKQSSMMIQGLLKRLPCKLHITTSAKNIRDQH